MLTRFEVILRRLRLRQISALNSIDDNSLHLVQIDSKVLSDALSVFDLNKKPLPNKDITLRCQKEMNAVFERQN